MAMLTHFGRCLAGWMVAAALAGPASADSVSVQIRNASKAKWTLKHDAVPNVSVSLSTELATGPVQVACQTVDGRPKPNYFDLEPGKTYTVYLEGKEPSTKIDCLLYLGGSNRNYKMIRIAREVPRDSFVATSDVGIKEAGFQKFLAAPMATPPSPDTVVSVSKTGIEIREDNYPLAAAAIPPAPANAGSGRN